MADTHANLRERAKRVGKTVGGHDAAYGLEADCFCPGCRAERAALVELECAYQQGRDEVIAAHRCSCEQCSTTSQLCPASASSIAMELTTLEAAVREDFEHLAWYAARLGLTVKEPNGSGMFLHSWLRDYYEGHIDMLRARGQR